MQTVAGLHINVGHVLQMLPEFALARFIVQIYQQPQSSCDLGREFPPPPSRCFNNAAIRRLSGWEWTGEDCCDSDCWECLQHPSPSHHTVDYNLSLTEIAFVTSFPNGDLFYLWAAKEYKTALNYIPQSPPKGKGRCVSICGWQGVLHGNSLQQWDALSQLDGFVCRCWLWLCLLRMCLLHGWVIADEPRMCCRHSFQARGKPQLVEDASYWENITSNDWLTN